MRDWFRIHLLYHRRKSNLNKIVSQQSAKITQTLSKLKKNKSNKIKDK